MKATTAAHRHWIYKITNTVSGKIYIGMTCNLDRRRYEHMESDWWLVRNLQNGSPLAQDMHEIGRDKFRFDAVEECVDRHQASVREGFWMRELKTREEGYNRQNATGQRQLKLGGEYYAKELTSQIPPTNALFQKFPNVNRDLLLQVVVSIGLNSIELMSDDEFKLAFANFVMSGRTT